VQSYEGRLFEAAMNLLLTCSTQLKTTQSSIMKQQEEVKEATRMSTKSDVYLTKKMEEHDKIKD
jgi:hypothetical protein